MTTKIAGSTYWVLRSNAGLIKNAQYWFCLTGLLLSRMLVAQSQGGFASGATSYCDSINSGFISLIGYSTTVLYWEQSTDGQATWQNIANNISTQSYYNLKQTTSFRAIVQDGSFPPDTSTVATITIHVPGIAGYVAGGDTVCSGANSGTLLLTATQGTVMLWQSRVGSGPWQNINNTSFVLNYSNLVNSTIYRAVIRRVPNCIGDTSAPTNVNVDDITLRGSINGSDSVCYGAPGGTLALTGERGTSFNWLASVNSGQTWSQAQAGGLNYVYPTVTLTTLYAVVVKNGVCPADTTENAIVLSYPEIIVDAGTDQTITRNESAQIGGEASSGTVEWHPGKWLADSTAASTTAKPRLTTRYKLTITDIYGCRLSDSVLITVIIPFPTAITPNGDGVNDTFEIYQVEKFPKCSLNIYDRWGNLVFDAVGYANEWGGKAKDGTVLPESTYYYTFDYGVGEKPLSGYVLIKR